MSIGTSVYHRDRVNVLGMAAAIDNTDENYKGVYILDILYVTKNNTGRKSVSVSGILEALNDSDGTKSLNILDKISFFTNQAGSNTLRVGSESQCCTLADDGTVTGKTGLFDWIHSNGYISAAGNISATGDISADGNMYCTHIYANNVASDRRIKKNIRKTDKKALDVIKKIKHKQYEMKEDGNHFDIGYIAQEMEIIDKNFIMKREQTDKFEERYYINMLPILATATKAIQEQQEEIEQLKEKDKQKDEIIADLIKRIENLEKGANK